VHQVDASLAATGGPAGESVLRPGKSRPSGKWWKPLSERARRISPSFFILLIMAGLIGAVGILTNSQILIVGAMVVGPNTTRSSPLRSGSTSGMPAW
jgi:hypothetical protein